MATFWLRRFGDILIVYTTYYVYNNVVVDGLFILLEKYKILSGVQAMFGETSVNVGLLSGCRFSRSTRDNFTK